MLLQAYLHLRNAMCCLWKEQKYLLVKHLIIPERSHGRLQFFFLFTVFTDRAIACPFHSIPSLAAAVI